MVSAIPKGNDPSSKNKLALKSGLVLGAKMSECFLWTLHNIYLDAKCIVFMNSSCFCRVFSCWHTEGALAQSTMIVRINMSHGILFLCGLWPSWKLTKVKSLLANALFPPRISVHLPFSRSLMMWTHWYSRLALRFSWSCVIFLRLIMSWWVGDNMKSLLFFNSSSAENCNALMQQQK